MLRFRHLGLIPRLSCYEVCESGWEHFLASLLDYADHGNGSRFDDSLPLGRRSRLIARFLGEQYRDGPLLT
ncbi:MAG: hypothetical protein ACXVHB_28535 [Solirubrobacteraceae bacterium]